MNQQKLAPIAFDTMQPLSDLICGVLREAIRDGIYKAEDRLMEVNLAEQLGVSRTPVREALRKLEKEGFVVMVPRKGAYVADISESSIEEVFEIRIVLEKLVASLAAQRINDEEIRVLRGLLVDIQQFIKDRNLKELIRKDVEFHEILYGASRNERLVEMVCNMREQMLRFRSFSAYLPGRLEESWQEHETLLEAIERRDALESERLAEIHMLRAKAVLIDGIRKGMHRELP